MKTWAAIDIMGGKTVTLVRGSPSSRKTWGMTPLEAAARWENEGAGGLHVVDLDRALETGTNSEAISALTRRAGVPVQVGGGIRTLDDLTSVLGMGADRVVLGTAAVSSPDFLKQAVGAAGNDRVAVAVDFSGDRLMTHGWRREAPNGVHDFVSSLGGLGVGTVVATSVERDGAAAGPDLDAYSRLRSATACEMIASGGIRSAADVGDLGRLGLQGVILGRALYEGMVRLEELGGV